MSDKNPRWLAWERAGSPKPSDSPHFPNALAFSLWLGPQWKAFAATQGVEFKTIPGPYGVPELTASEAKARFVIQCNADGSFDRWLAEQYPEVARG